MPATVINLDEALSDGADLWVLPTTTFSAWTKLLDWPLNLQISRASGYTARKISPELAAILQQNDLQFDANESEKKNLIIATDGLIPAKQILVVSGETWETWSKAAVKVWQDLGTPQARFFLPTFSNWEKEKKSWPAAANIESVQIVADQISSTEG
jgi:hypothetical protein